MIFEQGNTTMWETPVEIFSPSYQWDNKKENHKQIIKVIECNHKTINRNKLLKVNKEK